ncbi:hypothetical protein [Adlercreutzia caecimuris]|uniref:hypothetical protein n=1 Tax=Adlercreutzia caecimuris TaxID=671266 RepID=UPI0024955A1D|nr:hypothetical protein [Adlercreutzia caecimuris]
MSLTAKTDFKAVLGKGRYGMKKGEAFTGSPMDGERLARLGLLAEEPSKQRKEVKK